MYKPALTTGALLAGLAVVLGAFGAHKLKEYLDLAELATFETGVRYQFYHSFALLFTGIIYGSFPFRPVKLASTFFITGIVLFSGSLYLLSFLNATGTVGLKGIGIITPVGGLFFIAGWACLLLGLAKKK